MAPQVSVVLPTHNRSSMLRQALRCALDQEGVDLEVIVVDDGSTDDTPEVLERIEDERLRVIRHERPQGVSNARNAAIESATGEWIAFLDDDDLWAPGKLRAQLSECAEQSHSVCFSTVVHLAEGGSVQRIAHVQGDRDMPRELLVNNPVGGPSAALIRADVLERVGGFDVRLSAMADWDLWIRATRTGTVGVADEPLVAYRHHEQSMTQSEAAEMMSQFELLREKHGQEAIDAGLEFGSEWHRRWVAAQDLASGHRLRAAAGWLRSAISTRTPRDVLRAVGALGGDQLQRLGRRAEDRMITRPEWLDRYV
ncbi:MAG: glycosyltransferase family 2 protein [Solirubrobacterales bacterium]